MNARYALDTSIAIAAMRRPPDGLRRRLSAASGRLAISTVTAAELQYGVERSSAPPQDRTKVEALLALVEILPYDLAAAAHTGEIRAALARLGTPIGAYDGMLAGHARSLGLVVVTHNTREFDRVPGLLVEDWMD